MAVPCGTANETTSAPEEPLARLVPVAFGVALSISPRRRRASTRIAVREVDRLLANVPLLRVDLGRRRDVGNVFDLLKGLHYLSSGRGRT